MKDAISWLCVKGRIYRDWCYLPGKPTAMLEEESCLKVESWALTSAKYLITDRKEYLRKSYGLQN